MKIIVWSADWCGYCHALMDWLAESGIDYEEKNGETNPKLTGYPTSEIYDNKGQLVAIVEGFDRPRILAAIKEASGQA